MTIADKILRAKTDYDEVYEAGKNSQYDEFWDNYQQNGSRGSYEGVFSGNAWTEKTFKPKYDIVNFYTGMNMFWANTMAVELVELLNDLGVLLDFSNATNCTQTFQHSKFTRLGVINLCKAVNCTNTFSTMKNLVTIDKIIVSATTVYNHWFDSTPNLENVIFEGEIANNGLNLQWSTKLSKASITSIINCLSTTTSGLTVTLSKTAVESAFGSTTSTEWTTLVGTRSNWTISLI